MKIAVIGRGNVGRGLAKLWRAAGHDVTEIGHEGGDASGSDAVLLAVRPPQIASALEGVQGVGDAPVIDATNVGSDGRRRASSRSPRSSGRKRAGPLQRRSMRTSRRFTTDWARRASLRAWCTPPTKRPGR